MWSLDNTYPINDLMALRFIGSWNIVPTALECALAHHRLSSSSTSEHIFISGSKARKFSDDFLFCKMHRMYCLLADGYSKSYQTVPMTRSMATKFMSIFLENWIVAYAIVVILTTENGTPFAANISETVCNSFVFKHLTAIIIHLQTN